MSLEGTVVIDAKGAVFVRYVSVQSSQPVKVTMLWRVQRVRRDGYSIGASPETGHIVRSNGDEWHGPGYSLYFPGGQEAESVVKEDIPCPKVRRGLETRWNVYQSRWEKLLPSRGWVAA